MTWEIQKQALQKQSFSCAILSISGSVIGVHFYDIYILYYYISIENISA